MFKMFKIIWCILLTDTVHQNRVDKPCRYWVRNRWSVWGDNVWLLRERLQLKLLGNFYPRNNHKCWNKKCLKYLEIRVSWSQGCVIYINHSLKVTTFISSKLKCFCVMWTLSKNINVAHWLYLLTWLSFCSALISVHFLRPDFTSSSKKLANSTTAAESRICKHIFNV